MPFIPPRAFGPIRARGAAHPAQPAGVHALAQVIKDEGVQDWLDQMHVNHRRMRHRETESVDTDAAPFLFFVLSTEGLREHPGERIAYPPIVGPASVEHSERPRS